MPDDQQRQVAEDEPEPWAVHAARQDEEEEDELDAGDARAHGTQGCAQGREHAEHRERLGVDAVALQLGEDDGDQHRQDGDEDER